MKLGQHDNKLISNHEGGTEKFSIGNAAVIIKILRGYMYTKKYTTMVQEYVSNARDAAREAGKTDNSFEITVPTRLNPVFKVRDFGIGVSPERMSKVFIQYGNSTKRDDNKATGGFGLGAKIGFAVSDSFSIITYIDGVKRSYVAHIGLTNEGQLDQVSTEPTIEKNGTEIQVPIKNESIDETRDAVVRAVYFWEQRPVIKGLTRMPDLVKGQTVGSAEIIDSRILPEETDANYTNQPLLLVDGIPYQLDEVLVNKCPNLRKLSGFVNQKLLLRIGNGVVEVAATRETVADSPVSITALEKLAKTVALEVRTYISDSFGKVKTMTEYVNTYKLLSKAFQVETGFAKFGEYRINGNELYSPNLEKVAITEIYRRGYGSKKVSVTKHELTRTQKHIPLERFNKLYVINTKESQISLNKRFRQFLTEGGQTLYLISAMPQYTMDAATQKPVLVSDGAAELQKVLSDLAVKDIQTITYVVLPKEEKIKVTREKTQFCLHTFDGNRHTYTNLDDNEANEQDWLYIPIEKDKTLAESAGFSQNDLSNLDEYLTEHADGIKICGVAPRALSMIDGNKRFKPFADYIKAYKVSKQDLLEFKYSEAKNQDLVRRLGQMVGLKDTKLTASVKEYKLFEKAAGNLPEILKSKIRVTKDGKDFLSTDLALTALVATKYPLVEEFTWINAKVCAELVHYINAKFKE